jgi:zinc transporter, ZIP family
MAPLSEALLATAAASACIPLGGLLALLAKRQKKWLDAEVRHFVVALGGGILIAAVSLVLLPEGMQRVQDPLAVAALFVAGGAACFALERHLGASRRESPQLAATLLDYVPESLALGGMFAAGAASAPLLAVLIGLQNLPEGFNAYLERVASGEHKPRAVLLQMLLLVALGPVLAALGWFFLSAHPEVLGAVMIAAAGAILYLIFQDIAPMSHMRNHWFPPFGAVCGFGLAMLGQQWMGG